MTPGSTAHLEAQLGRLLQVGVLTSAACLLTGLLLWMWGGAPTAATFILTAGLLILMATPILRVVVSLVEYVRLRDWFFVTTTMIVFGVLLATVTLALLNAGGRP